MLSDEEIKYMKNKINEVKAFLAGTKDEEVYLENLMPYMVFNEKDIVIIEKLLDLYFEQQQLNKTINGFKNFWEGITNSKLD